MKNFIIKKIDQEIELLTFDYDIKGFNYRPKKTTKNSKVNNIVIVNPEIINALINNSFNKKYKQLLEFYLNIIEEESDATEGSLMIALDEIARLRNIIIKKYHHFLKKQTEEKFLKRLKLLENEIRVKLIDFKLIKEQEIVQYNIMEEERGKSR